MYCEQAARERIRRGFGAHGVRPPADGVRGGPAQDARHSRHHQQRVYVQHHGSDTKVSEVLSHEIIAIEYFEVLFTSYPITTAFEFLV